MEKKSVNLMIITCFVLVLTLAMVSAVLDKSNFSAKKNNMSERRVMQNQSGAYPNFSGNMSERMNELRKNMTIAKNEANMTYGACIEENAKTKNICLEKGKTFFKTCKDSIKENSTQAQNRTEQCKANREKIINSCKNDFKESKAKCGKIKHNFINSIRYFFK